MCITDLMEQLNKAHSAFSKSAKNGKVYANFLVWYNEEKDEYGNNISLQLSSTKEKRDSEGKIYIGNAKRLETTKPISERDKPSDNWDANVPVREKESTQTTPADDLPF